jgi:GTP cyclohydrolase IA
MYCDEFFAGVKSPPFDNFALSSNKELKINQIILLDKIDFTSMCSHHFLPFSGRAWFMYIPNQYLVGASKPARLISHYASRPQLQELLGQQIINRFVEVVKPRGAMLVMRATHGCMSCRGVKQGNSTGMLTSLVHGCFKDELSTREEGLSLINLSAKLE